MHYDFSGHRNLDDLKSINVVDKVQECVTQLIAHELNAKIIYGATGSEESGTLVFGSFCDAIDFVNEIIKTFSIKILSQIKFRFGCSYRNITDDNIDEQIKEALRDAARCSAVYSKVTNVTRLTISEKSREQLPIEAALTDFTPITLGNIGSSEEAYYDYKRINDEKEHVIKYTEKIDPRVKIGIITVLLSEHTAMRSMMTNVKTVIFPGKGAGHQFQLGTINAFGGDEHIVALARTSGDGNNKAAIRASKLIEHFPNLEVIFMVGIAGGTPLISNDFPENDLDIIEKHIRLGDIVVSDSVLQYDYKKQKFEEVKLKCQPMLPNAKVMQAKDALDESASIGDKPWERYILEASQTLADNFTRPDNSTDLLYDYDGNIVAHPVDDTRNDKPHVFTGKIASANTVLKDPRKRDKLKEQYDVFAVEMEASGIADATWEAGIGYYVIRGISDYCDSHKNNKWHKYSSLAAAAYAKAVIEKLPSD